MCDIYPDSAMNLYFISYLNVFFLRASMSFFQNSSLWNMSWTTYAFYYIYPHNIVFNSISNFICDPSCDSTCIIYCTSSWDNIIQSCDHFLSLRSVLVFSVLELTLLNNVSIFLAVYTVLVLFYICTINTLVDVCTTLVASTLELRFYAEIFFICFWVPPPHSAVIWSYFFKILFPPLSTGLWRVFNLWGCDDPTLNMDPFGPRVRY